MPVVELPLLCRACRACRPCWTSEFWEQGVRQVICLWKGESQEPFRSCTHTDNKVRVDMSLQQQCTSWPPSGLLLRGCTLPNTVWRVEQYAIIHKAADKLNVLDINTLLVYIKKSVIQNIIVSSSLIGQVKLFVGKYHVCSWRMWFHQAPVSVASLLYRRSVNIRRSLSDITEAIVCQLLCPVFFSFTQFSLLSCCFIHNG